MSKIEIPFKEAFKPLIMSGVKYRTSRNKRYGGVGDCFEIGNKKFWLVEVKKYPLKIVRDKFWKSEGVDSPEHFEEIWVKIHPLKGFVEEQEVWVHTW